MSLTIKLGLFYIIVTIILCTPPSYDKYRNDFKTGTVSLILPSLGLTSNLPFYSFLIGYNFTSSPDLKAIGVVGLKSPPSTNFNFNISSNSINLTTAILQVKVYEKMLIQSLTVNYLIGFSNSSINQNLVCFTCSIINKGQGPRSQSWTIKTSFIQGKFEIMPFITALKMSNLNGSSYYLKVDANHIPYSQNIQLVVITDQKNTVQSICIDIIQINFYSLDNPTNKTTIYHISQLTLTKDVILPILLDLGNYMSKFRDDNRMFFAMKGFRINKEQYQQFYINTTAYNFTTSTQYGYISGGTSKVDIAYFFIAKRQPCPGGTWYDFMAGDCITTANCTSQSKFISLSFDYCDFCHYSCQTCTGPEKNQCSGCNSTKIRGILNNTCPCSTNSYIDVGEPFCKLCSTIIPGCLTCQMINYTYYCTNCSTGYQTNKTCICNSTYQYIVSGFCVNTTGCSNVSQINNISGVCTACATQLNFTLLPNTNFQCECLSGHKIKQNAYCVLMCGDGIIDTGQGCDDGNNINGDGCSSVCQIETSWICSGAPSKCTLISVAISSIPSSQSFSLTVNYIRRVTTSNTMRICIEASSLNLTVSSSTLKTMIYHNVSALDFQVQVSDGDLIIDFDYNKTIEGDLFYIKYIMVQNLVTNSYSLNSKALGMNAMLTYDIYYSHHQILQIILIILSGGGILLFILSIFSQKMIGIEMIQTIQTVFFLLLTVKSCPLALSALQKLRYINGYNIYAGESYNRIYSLDFNISQLGIQKEFLLSFNLMYILLFFCLITMIILKIIISCQKRKLQKPEKLNEAQLQELLKKIRKTEIILNFIFQKIYFMISALFMFIIIIATVSQLVEISSYKSTITPQFNNTFNLLAVTYVMVYLSLVLINYNNRLKLFEFSNINQFYIAFYTLYEFVIICLVGSSYQSNWMPYLILVLIVANIIFVGKLKPYSQKKHNFALIYHKLVIITSLIFYIMANLSKSYNQVIYLLGAYIITLQIFFVLVWNSCRLYIWRANVKNQQQNSPKKKYQKLGEQNLDKTNSKKKIEPNDNIFNQSLEKDDMIKPKFQTVSQTQTLKEKNELMAIKNKLSKEIKGQSKKERSIKGSQVEKSKK